MGALTVATYPTSGPIELMVTVPLGSLQLIAEDRKDTTVVISPTDAGVAADVEAAAGFEIDYGNGRLEVGTTLSGISRLIGHRKSGSVAITIELPTGSAVHIDGGVLDADVAGRVGMAEVRIGAGSIDVDEASGADLSTGVGRIAVGVSQGDLKAVAAGEIAVQKVSGRADIKNQNGKTRLREALGPTRVRSANGDIDIQTARSDVEARTSNGSIRIGDARQGVISLATGMGSVGVGVGEGVTAWVDAKTRFGRVRNTLEPTTSPEGGQKLEITARTSFGEIEIGRAER